MLRKGIRLREPETGEFNGIRFRLYPDSHSASAVVYFNGYIEYDSMRFVERLLQPGNRFVDVGANIGVYACLAAKIVGSSGHVHAFEPNPKVYERLLENIRLNGYENVTSTCAAVGAADGYTRLIETENDSLGRISENTAEMDRSSSDTRLVTLDSTIEERIDLVKIDVEGAEPLVLEGMKRHLHGKDPPVVLCELDGYSKRYGYDTDRVIGLLRESGCRIYKYDGSANVLQATDRPWELSVQRANVVAARPERLEGLCRSAGINLIE